MSWLDSRSSRFGAIALGTFCVFGAVSLGACGKNGGGRGKQSDLAKWVDSPSNGSRDGNVIKFPQLQVKFEVPDTLYVFRNCGEASHSPDGAERWIPIITCASTGDDVFGQDEGEEDYFADEEASAAGAEPINLTFYVTHKTRPLDERAVTWFEGQFKEAGLDVDEISYQHDYHKKTGIYAKLHIVDGNGEPEREIIQFMFPREDVVFIARMDYPFGETRSVEQDWQYIMWNFDFTGAPAE
ncbi:MAG: hypothetical protein H6712_29055 [Myxococcales bacterium]|nr:hypothetical protein [Myxococcales bacterium]MCB9717933.1 hypothetical protein [Myxococcales bacterium]